MLQRRRENDRGGAILEPSVSQRCLARVSRALAVGVGDGSQTEIGSGVRDHWYCFPSMDICLSTW
jgi:hypothetical protein